MRDRLRLFLESAGFGTSVGTRPNGGGDRGGRRRLTGMRLIRVLAAAYTFGTQRAAGMARRGSLVR
jgi:hypothetical protein